MAQIKDDLLAYFPYFKDSKGQSDQGYLFILEEGDSWTLFEKNSKVFREGKKALTSFEASFPDSFIEEKNLYLMIDGKEPRYLKPTIKGVTSILGSNRKSEIKNFISENKIALDTSGARSSTVKYPNGHFFKTYTYDEGFSGIGVIPSKTIF